MTKEKFRKNLLKSTDLAIALGRKYISNRIAERVTYDIEFNASYDDGIDARFDVYESDRDRVALGLEIDQVVEELYRNGKTPAWIDIAIIKSNSRNTRLNLICAGRFSKELKDLYYTDQGTHPFGIKSPRLLPWVKEDEKYYLLYRRSFVGRFLDDLRWRIFRLKRRYLHHKKKTEQ